MESVRDLYGTWSASLHCLGVRAAPIAADNLDTRVPDEPACKSIGGPIWRQIDRVMSLEIDEDAAVGATTPHREIVHAQDARCRSLRKREATDMRKQGIATERNAEVP